MATQVSNVKNVSSGLCPHGLPPGACPICSKMGGGGSLRAGERPQKAGEMSYHECAMIGNMIRARQLAQKNHAKQLAQQSALIKNFETLTRIILENLHNFIVKIPTTVVMKPIVIIAKIIVLPIVYTLQVISKIYINIQNLKFEILDKLNALFGEAKAFLEKKISDLLNNVKSKFVGLFKISKKNNTDDKDSKIDDDKRIFNLKTILHKIKRKKKEKDGSSKNKQ